MSIYCADHSGGINLRVRGHGTYVDNEEVIASVVGTVERVNKLVTVRAIRTRCVLNSLGMTRSLMWEIFQRYNPEIGDLVVGRITEVTFCLTRRDSLELTFIQVQPRRWKVDANSRQDAVLMLSSVNLPGGVQVQPAGNVDNHLVY